MIGGFSRCRRPEIIESFGNVAVDIDLAEKGKIYGNFFDSAFYLFEGTTPPRNDGLSIGFSGCELCNCLSGNYIRSGTFDGPFTGFRNVLPDLTPGVGFVNVGTTVFRAPDDFPNHLKRWFYFGPVATLVKSWRVSAPRYYFGGESLAPSVTAQLYAPSEPRERTGYTHIDDGNVLNLGNPDNNIPPSPYLLSYTTINGAPLFDILGGRDPMSLAGPIDAQNRTGTFYKRPAGPVAFGDTITIEYWLNRSMADWQPYWHTMRRNKTVWTFDRLGVEQRVTDEIETGQEVGEWDRVEAEEYFVAAEREFDGDPEGFGFPRWIRKPVFVRQDRVTEIGSSGDLSSPAARMYVSDDYYDSRMMIGDFGWFVNDALSDEFIVRSTGIARSWGNVFMDRWVSLSGDYVEPVIGVVDGVRTAIQNPLKKQHPCMYPIRVSQTGYHAPANPLP